MPVFDFSSTPENEKKQDPICTYTTFRSNEGSASAEKPILILDNSSEKWNHHAVGVFGNQSKRTNFEFKEEGSSAYADILQIDARFVSLIRWLGENHINVRLSGENRNDGYAVYKIRETAFGGGTKAVCRGWIFTIHDGAAVFKQCSRGRRTGRGRRGRRR